MGSAFVYTLIVGGVIGWFGGFFCGVVLVLWALRHDGRV